MDKRDPSRAAWDDWTRGAPLQQSFAYGAAAAALGARVERITLGPPGDPDGVLQVIRRFGVGYAPVGIHWRSAPRTGAVPPGGPILIAGKRGWRIAEGPEIALRSIEGDPRPAMAKKWRNRLHKAERSHLRVKRIAGCPAWLAEAEARQRRDRGYRSLPSVWLERLGAADPSAVVTWGAFLGPEPVAGICVIRHSGRWTYHLGWSGEAGRARSAHHLLLTRAMEAAAEQGVGLLDMGRIDNDPPGLRRFKLGAGAEAIRLDPLRLTYRRGSAPSIRSKESAGIMPRDMKSAIMSKWL